MASESKHLSLAFGRDGRLDVDIEPARVLSASAPVPALPDLPAAVDEALARPIDYPPLEQALIPEDTVALALEPGTPAAPELIAGVWRVLERRGVAAENVVIVQPQGPIDAPLPDPRTALPTPVRNRMRWKLHDPDKTNDCAYVASTASGDRIYISRDLVESDVSISIGAIRYDSLLGARGTNSALYPWLSNRDAIVRAQGQGHDELDPEDDRPLRQLMDEVGWLVGTMFTLQVIPAAGGGVAAVLAGAADPVQRQGRKLLARFWKTEVATRPEIVVAAIDHDAESTGWKEIGAALATCRRLVARGGRIILLTDLDARLGPAMELARTFEEPRDALQPVRKLASDDFVPATQLAAAADWARITLLSRLDSDVVEELFMTPASNATEVDRLLHGSETIAFLPSAQHVFARVRGAE
ncbi:MAG: DUF2088 domain-containing protein [Planctomycetaceae bacterium]|nr:DUF2088 domain-containing protein [Planctomycetaceae bacterium]